MVWFGAVRQSRLGEARYGSAGMGQAVEVCSVSFCRGLARQLRLGMDGSGCVGRGKAVEVSNVVVRCGTVYQGEAWSGSLGKFC